MHWLAVPSANLHTTFDLIFTTFSLHHLFAPRTSWCVEPVSNEAFYYLNPDCTLPPSLSPTACILPFTLHLAAACCFCWRGREHDSSGKNLSQTKIPSLSLSLSQAPRRGGGMEGAKAFSFCRGRLSENKANHMAANPAVNERERAL